MKSLTQIIKSPFIEFFSILKTEFKKRIIFKKIFIISAIMGVVFLAGTFSFNYLSGLDTNLFLQKAGSSVKTLKKEFAMGVIFLLAALFFYIHYRATYVLKKSSWSTKFFYKVGISIMFGSLYILITGDNEFLWAIVYMTVPAIVLYFHKKFKIHNRRTCQKLPR